MLRYAPIKIMDKSKCKLHYAHYPLITEMIDKFMICSMEDGQLNEEGTIIISPTPSPEARRVMGSNEMSNDSAVEIKKRTLFNQTNTSRRSSWSGICQVSGTLSSLGDIILVTYQLVLLLCLLEMLGIITRYRPSN